MSFLNGCLWIERTRTCTGGRLAGRWNRWPDVHTVFTGCAQLLNTRYGARRALRHYLWCTAVSCTRGPHGRKPAFCAAPKGCATYKPIAAKARCAVACGRWSAASRGSLGPAPVGPLKAPWTVGLRHMREFVKNDQAVGACAGRATSVAFWIDRAFVLCLWTSGICARPGGACDEGVRL